MSTLMCSDSKRFAADRSLVRRRTPEETKSERRNLRRIFGSTLRSKLPSLHYRSFFLQKSDMEFSIVESLPVADAPSEEPVPPDPDKSKSLLQKKRRQKLRQKILAK
jgi:hypothetical protein